MASVEFRAEAAPDEEFDRQLDAVTRRLVREYPNVGMQTVAALVAEGRERLVAARVREFRTMLVEKHARDVLRDLLAGQTTFTHIGGRAGEDAGSC